MSIQGYLTALLQGLPVTLSLSFTGILTAFMLAIILSLLLSLNKEYLNKLIKAYLIGFTGTPLLVQLFLIYYGLAQFNDIKEHLPYLWNLFSSPWFCAYLALSLNSAAYTTQIFYGALKAVPTGQWQACSALGMNKIQALRIILPYALKRAMSTYANEVVFIVKGTALASTITLMDLMGYNQFLNGRYYDFSILILTGCIYLVINGLLSIIMRFVEWRALRFERI